MIRVKTFTGENSHNTDSAATDAAKFLNEYLEENPGAHLCNYQVSTAATTGMVGSERDGFSYWHTFTITAVVSLPDPSPFMEGTTNED